VWQSGESEDEDRKYGFDLGREVRELEHQFTKELRAAYAG
jgi:hypothetical protein